MTFVAKSSRPLKGQGDMQPSDSRSSKMLQRPVEMRLRGALTLPAEVFPTGEYLQLTFRNPEARRAGRPATSTDGQDFR